MIVALEMIRKLTLEFEDWEIAEDDTGQIAWFLYNDDLNYWEYQGNLTELELEILHKAYNQQ